MSVFMIIVLALHGFTVVSAMCAALGAEHADNFYWTTWNTKEVMHTWWKWYWRCWACYASGVMVWLPFAHLKYLPKAFRSLWYWIKPVF